MILKLKHSVENANPFICLQKKKLFININSGDLFFWDVLLVE